jgi:hypothetical protein
MCLWNGTSLTTSKQPIACDFFPIDRVVLIVRWCGVMGAAVLAVSERTTNIMSDI